MVFYGVGMVFYRVGVSVYPVSVSVYSVGVGAYAVCMRVYPVRMGLYLYRVGVRRVCMLAGRDKSTIPRDFRTVGKRDFIAPYERVIMICSTRPAVVV